MLATKEIKSEKKLPVGWRIEKLGDVFDVVTGNTPPKKDPENYGDDIPFVKPPELRNSVIDKAEDNLSNLGATKSRVLPPFSVLVSCIGNLGKIAMNKIPVAFNQQINALKCSKEFDYKYPFYFCQSSAFKNQLQSASSATTVAIVNKSSFEKLKIVVPPPAEQHRIVQKIEELFSELDYAITTLKTTRQQLQTYRQSVLKHAFEGHFTGGNKKWKLDRIGSVLGFINNGYTPSPAKMSGKGDVQFLKVYNLNFDGTLNYNKNPVFISKEVHETELKRSRTYPNDVLINIVGPPLGKVSLVPPIAAEFNINQAIVLFRPNEKVIPKFLRYFLQSPQVIHWLEGTSKATAGQYNVKVSTCREILIPIIDTELQEKIVFEIETRLSESDYLLQTINQQLIHAESLRQSILQQAFSGEL